MKKIVLLGFLAFILTLFSSLLVVSGLWPCSPCFPSFGFSDYYEGELKIRSYTLEIDNASVSASPDTPPYVSIDKTSVIPGEVFTISGLDTDGSNIEIELNYRNVNTGLYHTEIAILNQTRKISLVDLTCENSIITAIIKNEGTENIELSSMGFLVYGVSVMDPGCDKTVIGPGETTICDNIEAIDSTISTTNDVTIVGPSNKVLDSVYCSPTTKTCVDSDNGKFYYTKGVVVVCTQGPQSGSCGAIEDSCNGDVLNEKYCEGSDSQIIQYTCPNGCSDGACLSVVTTTTPTTNICTDSDGGKNYYVKGYATTDEGYHKHWDSCTHDLDTGIYWLHETYCENNTIKTEAYQCPNACENGVCLSSSVACGNGICDDDELSMKPWGQITSCPQDCGYEIDPYDSDVTHCTSSGGVTYSTTEYPSASWFAWGGCARYKYYNVNKGQELRFYVRTDTCSGCICYHPNFYVYEYENGQWVQKEYIDLEDVKGLKKDAYYTPNSNKIKIHGSSCFYLDVFSPEPVSTITVTTTPETVTTIPETVTTTVPERCWNHAQCSKACDNRGNEKWRYSNKWEGTCPDNVYGCMTRDCCIGQCLYKTTGDCVCRQTNKVDIYGDVCPTGTECESDCRCHPIVNASKLQIDIISPENGQSVSGTTTVTAKASSDYALGEMTLSIQRESEDVSEVITFTNCGGGVVCPGGGEGCLHSVTCDYDWDISSYSGEIFLSVMITDDNGDEAGDSVKVAVINYPSCNEACKSEGYRYGDCGDDCGEGEVLIAAGECSNNTHCCCSKKLTCPYECCVNDNEYLDKPCPTTECSECVSGEECPECIQPKCVDHKCVSHPEEEFRLHFKAGWNMFSFPVNDYRFLKGIVLDVPGEKECPIPDHVWHYSNGRYIDVLEDPDSVQDGWGYWVNMDYACMMSVVGDKITIGDFPELGAGWNHIGAPSKTMNFYHVIGDCNLLSGPWWYNPASNNYQKSQVLMPGEGYWVKVKDECTLGSDIPPLPPEDLGIGRAFKIR